MKNILVLEALLCVCQLPAMTLFSDHPVHRDQKLAIILGGGHAAVTAVEAAERCGWQAVLVEPSNHAGGMLANANHSWLLNGSTGNSVPRPCGAMKKEFFARIMDCGGYPLLLSHCGGLLVQDNAAVGIVVANKLGTFAIYADAVIDASEEQIAARHLLGLPPKQQVVVESIFEIANAHAITDITFKDLPGNVTWHRTLKEGTVSISSFKTIDSSTDWLAPSKREMQARYEMGQLNKKIMHECIGMGGVQLQRFGQLRVITPERQLPATVSNLLRIQAQLPVEPTTNDVRQLEYSTMDNVTAFLKSSMVKADAGKAVLKSTGDTLAFSRLDNDDSKLLHAVAVTPTQTACFDVLVAGGGTGGSAVMTALSEHKINALTVEMLPFLGGTTTAGGVSSAWHGYTKGAYAKYAEQRKKHGSMEGGSAFWGSVRYWDKMFRVAANKQSFLGNAVVCGATMQDNRMTSALVYSETGFRDIQAKIYVDTTGDADLCAQAGIPTEFGAPETGWIQSSSCWGTETWKASPFYMGHYGNDLDVVDPTDYADVIRGLALAHRNNSDYQISSIYTQRESRRIIGYEYLTVRDIFLRKFRTDAVAVSSCLFDSHGRSSSELAKSFMSKDALNEHDQEIHVLIPLGAYRPKGTANLMVASKAISGERDATSLCRMNPEITNGGFAIGTVASHYIAKQLNSLDEVDIGAVRAELHEYGVLPDWAMIPAEPEWTFEYAVSRLDAPNGNLPAVVMPKEQIVPVLRQRLLNPETKEIVKTAEALTWFGCADGQDILLKRLRDFMALDMAKFEDKGTAGFVITDVNGKEFPWTEESPNSTYGFPNIGAVLPGRAYSIINQLIRKFSYLDTPETMEPVLELAERATAVSDSLRMGTTPYAIARKDSVTTYAHERLWALANFFQRRPTPKAIPALSNLLQMKHIGGNICHGHWSDVPYFQMTYLEIMLADALQRCGGELGTKRLEEFSTDSRAIFRNMAKRCLENKNR